MVLSAFASSRIVRLTSLVLALTIALGPASYAKKASFDMPACEKLDNSQVNDVQQSNDPGAPTVQVAGGESDGAPAGTETPQTDSGQAHVGNLLQPLKLTDDSQSYSVGKDGKMKLKVQKNVKNKDEQAAAGEGNDGVIQSKLMQEAKKVNAMPLALQETDSEAQQKLDIVGEAEKTQLSDLWSATINRSPDIQFVIGRMQPHSDPNHATSTMIKLLGGILFSAAQAVPMMMGPGMGTMMAYGGVGSGASMLQSLISNVDAKNDKKNKISQEEATMLYKIVRETADKLVMDFRNYKRCRSQYDRAETDCDDIKAMVAEAKKGQDPAKTIEMEYTIRKAQRDLDNITDQARVYRQALTDLAGTDAVAKLDEQVDEEQTALKNMTGGQIAKPADDAAKPDGEIAKKEDAAAPAADAPKQQIAAPENVTK